MSDIQKSNHSNHSFLRKTIKGMIWFLLIVTVLFIISLFCLNSYLASNKTKVLDKLSFLKNGVINFDEATISVFKNFPSTTLSLNNVVVKDSLSKNGAAPMLQVDELNAALTIVELLKKKVEINAVELKRGTINLLVDKNGKNNITDLFNTTRSNSTSNSRNSKILLEALDLSLIDMKIAAKDQQNAIESVSQIGNLKSTLTKNGQDWVANIMTNQSNVSFNNLKKQESINSQIGELSGTIQMVSGNWSIDLETKNTAIQYNNFKKNTSIVGRLNQVNTEVNHNDNQWVAATDMNVHVKELAFKKERGSFVENSTLSGKFITTFDEGKISIAPFDLQINEEQFIFKAAFQPKSLNTISLENSDTHFDNTIVLLPQNLQKKIAPYRVGKPFYSKTLIQGTFKNGEEPLVSVDVNLPNNKVQVLGENFDQVKLKGKFVNRLNDDNRKWSEPKNNFRFEVDQVTAKYRAFNLATKDALLTSTKATGLVLDLNANITGKANSISDWYRNDQFFFEKGNFELTAKINAPFQSFDDILIASNAIIRLDDFAVWYEPANVSFPFEQLNLEKKSGDANFKIVNSSFVKGHQVVAAGILKNINTLLFNNSNLATESEMHIVSKKLSWVDFINLFGQNGYARNERIKTDQEKKSSMKETIRGMYSNFQPRISLEVDTMAYYDILMLENFKTGIHFEDPNTVILEKTTFDYDRGTVDFSATLDIGQSAKTPFEIELHTTNLNLQKLLPAFDFFNIKLLADLEHLPDDVKINIKHKGIIDDQLGIITNASFGEITIESKAHNGTFATINYLPTADQSKLKTTVNLEGDPSLFNEFFKTEDFFFSEGRFTVDLNFLGDLQSKAQLMTETTAVFGMRDAYVYYKPVDVNFPLKQVDLNLKQDKADFSFFVRSDSMDRQILFDGAVENLSEIIIGNTGKTIKMDVNVTSPLLEWATFLDIFMPENNVIVNDIEKASKPMDVSNIKATVRGLLRTFNPTINLNLDKFVYSNKLAFDKLNASLHMQDSAYLVLDNTSFNFHDGNIRMEGEVNLTQLDKTSFETLFNSKNVDIAKLIRGLDYLNLPSLRSIQKLSGHLDMDFDFKGTIANGGAGLINEETIGKLDFKLSDVELAGFPNLDTIATKLRMKRRFEDLQFATLSNQLTINGNEIDIPLMEVQSNAVNLFVEGKLSYGDNTNIWLSFPIRNLVLRDYSVIQDYNGYASAGKKLFIEVTSNDIGENQYKLRLRKKKFYKSRDIDEQFRKDRKQWRKEKRMLKRQNRN